MQFSFQFPPADDAPAQARAALEVFDQILAPEVLEDLQLVVSELVTNSVKFGPKRSITLSLQIEAHGRVRGEVIDQGDGERAKVEMQDKSSMELRAVTGIYDAKGEMLKLDRNIEINSSTGYQGRLREALVDIRKGNVVSEQPVEVKMLQGTLNANRLDIFDSGDVVRFHGGVVMDMKLNQPPSQGKSDNQ